MTHILVEALYSFACIVNMKCMKQLFSDKAAKSLEFYRDLNEVYVFMACNNFEIKYGCYLP